MSSRRRLLSSPCSGSTPCGTPGNCYPIPNGVCDCSGNTGGGCGCGEPAPDTCGQCGGTCAATTCGCIDGESIYNNQGNTCGTNLTFDGCGICNGSAPSYCPNGCSGDSCVASTCPGGYACNTGSVDGYIGQVVCGQDCQTEYICTDQGWQTDGNSCASGRCLGGTECGGWGVDGTLGQVVCGYDCKTQELCTAQGWQPDGPC